MPTSTQPLDPPAAGTKAITHFADRLNAACRDKNAPVCVGLDPVLEKLPAALRNGEPVAVIENFCTGVIEAVAEHVPCIKIQSACFERYHGPGFDLIFKLSEQAKRAGLLVIVDAKRSDIGTSSAHYAATFLEGPHAADALTINPYLGADGMQPFLDAAAANARGLFALVRTSNPGGDAFQQLPLADGRTVARAVADLIAYLGQARPEYLAASGDSLLGAVVGATKPADAAELRDRMPGQIFLVPGFGAQGGTAEDVRACFRPDGTGALVTASRSVLYAFESAGDRDWQSAIGRAAAALKNDVNRALQR